MTFTAAKGEGAQALDINETLNALAGDTVVSGCGASAGSGNLEVDIASGTARVNASNVAVTSQTVTLSNGASEPRKDVIYIDTNGNAQISQGTAESVEPSANTRFNTYKPSPNDATGITGAIVAEVWVAANKSDTFTSSDIRDRRIVGENLDPLFNSVDIDQLDGDIVSSSLTTLEGNNLSINSGQLDASTPFNVTSISSSQNTSGSGLYLVDTSGGAVTLTLDTDDATNNETIGVVNISGTNDVTVDTEGSETIDPNGEASKTLSSEGFVIWFSADGTNWDSSLSADYESITANEASVTNETFVRAQRSSNSSSTASGTFINAYDGESKDVRGEFNSSQQFSPDESGEYEIEMWADIRGNTAAGDNLTFRVQNVTDASTVVFNNADAAGSVPIPNFAWTVNLDSSKTYELQARNDDSSFVIQGSGFSQCGAVIKRSIVG